MSEPWHCLDLFSGLGGFSQAFAESEDWAVITVDIQEQFDPDIQADVFELKPSFFGTDFDVVLASPPCTVLGTSGHHEKWDMQAREPVQRESKDAVALVYHTLGLIHGLSPTYWYLENPRRSRAMWFLGAPDEWVSYCQYGREYQKQTGLWGRHAPGMVYKKCRTGDDCHIKNTDTDGTCAIASMDRSSRAQRAKVPYELSAAIRDACEAGLRGEVPEQVSLEEVQPA